MRFQLMGALAVLFPTWLFGSGPSGPAWPVPLPGCEEGQVLRVAIPRGFWGIEVIDSKGRTVLKRGPRLWLRRARHAYFGADVDPSYQRLVAERCEIKRPEKVPRSCVLVEIDLDSGSERVVYAPLDDEKIADPIWDPEGRRVAFASGRDVITDLIVLDVARGVVERRFEGLLIEYPEDPFAGSSFEPIGWSADRRYLVDMYGRWLDLTDGAAQWDWELSRPWVPEVPLRGKEPGAYQHEIEFLRWSKCHRYVWYIQRTEGFFWRTTLNLYDVVEKKKRTVRVLAFGLYRK